MPTRRVRGGAETVPDLPLPSARLGTVGVAAATGGVALLVAPLTLGGTVGGVVADGGELELASAGSIAAVAAFFLSPSPQLTALPPNEVAIPHKPFLLGGTGGGFASPPADVPFVCAPLPITGDAAPELTTFGNSSSQIFSITPVLTNAHIVHVVLNLAKHHPFAHNGYIVDEEVVLLLLLVEATEDMLAWLL